MRDLRLLSFHLSFVYTLQWKLDYDIEALAEEFVIIFIGRQSVDEFLFFVFLFCFAWVQLKINFAQKNQPDGYEYALH